MSKTYAEEIRRAARDLRIQGWTLGEIRLKLSIPKNTLSGWVKDIRLTDEQSRRIGEKIAESAAFGRTSAVKVNRAKLEIWKSTIRDKASCYEQMAAHSPEIGRLICGILYLCEGSKYPASRAMTFGNSDPGMIKLFIGLLRKYFNIREDKLRCRIMPRWDQDIDEIQRFWSGITGIPLSSFYKTKPDMRSKGKKTLKPGYKGGCAVQYCDTSLQFELQAIGEAVMRG